MNSIVSNALLIYICLVIVFLLYQKMYEKNDVKTMPLLVLGLAVFSFLISLFMCSFKFSGFNLT